MALLMAGNLVDVPDTEVISPGAMDWVRVVMGKDARTRPIDMWIRQFILHKTVADHPEVVLEEIGPAGGAEATARWWQSSDGKINPYREGCAPGVTGEDGTAACLCDLVAVEAWHATVSNAWSVGWETREHADGRCYRVSLRATVNIALAVCEHLSIQLQMPKLGSYTGHPIPRMIHGGPDMVGIFGHRDSTEDRGHWDPGDELFRMLADRGVEQFDFAGGEDLRVWSMRQHQLNIEVGDQLPKLLVEDGVPGPATIAALKLAGYRSGVYALGR